MTDLHIIGAKRWRATFEGECPAGVPEHLMPVAILGAISIRADLVSFVKMARCDVVDPAGTSAGGDVRQ